MLFHPWYQFEKSHVETKRHMILKIDGSSNFVRLLFSCIIFWRLLASTAANRRFFNESGLLFLQKYARQYSLTDTFFFDRVKSQLRYPKNSLNTTIHDTYETRKQIQNSYYGTGKISIKISMSSKERNHIVFVCLFF